MLTLNEVIAQTKVVKAEVQVPSRADPEKAPAKPAEAEALRPPDEASASNDGFLVNGSMNNAATSKFSIAQGFGNTRKGSKALYNGGIGIIYDNAALDARPYSLTGLVTPKSSYSTITGIATVGGPIRIPHLLPHGPNFFVAYQWTRQGSAVTESGLVATLAQRSTTPIDPVAQALLALYPLPNRAGGSEYNYQTGVLNNSHQDEVQSRLDKSVGRKDEFYGGFAFESTRADSASLFGFRDTAGTLGLDANANWEHHWNHGDFAGRSSTISPNRTRAESSPSPARRRGRTSPTSPAVRRTQARSSMAMRTNIFASRSTTPISPTTGVFVRN